MIDKLDSSTKRKGSTSPNRLRLAPAQRHKYQREIAIYRGMFGGTDIAKGDVQAWAVRRAGIPEMAEVDREIASYRRWERAFRRRATQVRPATSQSGVASNP